MTTTLVIARRKGSKIRMFDTRTAKMGPWVAAPSSRGVRTGGRRSGKTVALAAQKAEYEAMREAMRRLPVIHVRSTLEAYTVAQIRTAGQKVLDMSFPSKARKADLITAYLDEQARRLA